MTDYQTDAHERTDFEPRDARALTECMSVLPEGGDVYTVVSASGAEYAVDAREGRCTCPDAQHNLGPDERCKHARRVAFATGARAIPPWADREAVDELLGAHVDGTPHVAATDGGAGVIDAGDDGEILDDEPDAQECDDDARPEECECAAFHTDTELPCWPCYRDGFNTPAPTDGDA